MHCRRLAFIAVVLGLVAVERLWPGPPSQDESTQLSSTDSQNGGSTALTSRADIGVSLSPAPSGSALVSQVVPSAMEISRRVSGPAVRLQALGPSDVHVGETFEIRIDAEAKGGVSELLIAVGYEKSRLALVGWFEGDFAKRGGVPAELAAEEPSEGNIQINFKVVGNGLSVAGEGSVAVLQFEAIRPGTSKIAFQDVIPIDNTGATILNAAVLQEGSVTVH